MVGFLHGFVSCMHMRTENIMLVLNTGFAERFC